MNTNIIMCFRARIRVAGEVEEGGREMGWWQNVKNLSRQTQDYMMVLKNKAAAIQRHTHLTHDHDDRKF